jgi:hypothetical protein
VRSATKYGLTTKGPKQEAGMRKDITAGGSLTIGLDLGDKWSEACVLEGSGEVLEAAGRE